MCCSRMARNGNHRRKSFHFSNLPPKKNSNWKISPPSLLSKGSKVETRCRYTRSLFLSSCQNYVSHPAFLFPLLRLRVASIRRTAVVSNMQSGPRVIDCPCFYFFALLFTFLSTGGHLAFESKGWEKRRKVRSEISAFRPRLRAGKKFCNWKCFVRVFNFVSVRHNHQ